MNECVFVYHMQTTCATTVHNSSLLGLPAADKLTVTTPTASGEVVILDCHFKWGEKDPFVAEFEELLKSHNAEFNVDNKRLTVINKRSRDGVHTLTRELSNML